MLAQEKTRVVTTSADLELFGRGSRRRRMPSAMPRPAGPHAIRAQAARWRGCAAQRYWSGLGSIMSPGLPCVLPTSNMLAGRCFEDNQAAANRNAAPRVERKAHVHAYGNTHHWLDPHDARPITASILTALANAAACGKGDLRGSDRDAPACLDARISEWEIVLKPDRGTKVVVVHDSGPISASGFGLQFVAAAEPDRAFCRRPPSSRPSSRAAGSRVRVRPPIRTQSCIGAQIARMAEQRPNAVPSIGRHRRRNTRSGSRRPWRRRRAR